jgi:hypothetical protein
MLTLVTASTLSRLQTWRWGKHGVTSDASNTHDNDKMQRGRTQGEEAMVFHSRIDELNVA